MPVEESHLELACEAGELRDSIGVHRISLHRLGNRVGRLLGGHSEEFSKREVETILANLDEIDGSVREAYNKIWNKARNERVSRKWFNIHILPAKDDLNHLVGVNEGIITVITGWAEERTDMQKVGKIIAERKTKKTKVIDTPLPEEPEQPYHR